MLLAGGTQMWCQLILLRDAWYNKTDVQGIGECGLWSVVCEDMIAQNYAQIFIDR